MPTYRVTASYITQVFADVEADSEEEAMDIANDMDGGSFDNYDDNLSDWTIVHAEKINETV